ncbi:MAG TPA: hypothetical protein VG368_03340 [Acidimicrobiales bacterium]|nr:hypothetical protein [Acidimicrobiales bacterium]
MIFGRRRSNGWEASLHAVQRTLTAARAEQLVTAEQLVPLREDAEEAQTRALVSENTGDARDARLAAGHVAQMEKGLDRLRRQIAALEAEEREILNRPLFDEE